MFFLQELARLKEELEILREDYKKIEMEKNQAIESLNLNKSSWETREAEMKGQIEQMQKRLNDLDKQNNLVHEQLETLGLKLTVSQTKVIVFFCLLLLSFAFNT